MNRIFQLLTIITCALFVGCEGNTDYTWQVTNNSSSDIQVWAESGFSLVEDSVVISTNSTEMIGFFNQLGGNKTEQLPENAFNSLVVVNAAGDTMQSSYIDPGSWISEIEQIKRVPSQYEHVYTFVVNDGDF